MSLAALATRQPAITQAPHKTCPVCWTLQNLDEIDPDYAETLREAIANPHVRYVEIEAALEAERKIKLAGDKISIHARGKCGARTRVR